jgi:hypothetical protein
MKISLDGVRQMRRRELTPDEKGRPYSKYFYREPAEIPAEDIARANADPADPSAATPIEESLLCQCH